MDHLYTIIGRKQVELDALHAEYNNLLAVLGEVATGAIEPSRVRVNRGARTWTVAPPPQTALAPIIELVPRDEATAADHVG